MNSQGPEALPVEVGADVRQDDAQWRVGVHGSKERARASRGARFVFVVLLIGVFLVVAAAHGLDPPRVHARDDARSRVCVFGVRAIV